MSTKEEKIKKQLEEERRKQEAFGKELEQLSKEEELRKLSLQESEQSSKLRAQDDTTRMKFQPSSNDKSWKKIIEDYKKKYPDVNIENNVLTFPTMDDAISFFKDQATCTPPRKFLASEIDGSGKLTGFHLFSCGDGNLYQGSLQEIHNQLEAAQLEKPEDKNINEGLNVIRSAMNPTHDFRSALLNTRDSSKDMDDESEHEQSSDMTPLSTKPKRSPY